MWLDGIFEQDDGGGELLCHVFAGGKRVATFEPQVGVFGYRLKPKHWDNIARTAELAFLWPLQENRAPGTVMLLTLIEFSSPPLPLAKAGAGTQAVR